MWIVDHEYMLINDLKITLKNDKILRQNFEFPSNGSRADSAWATNDIISYQCRSRIDFTHRLKMDKWHY